MKFDDIVTKLGEFGPFQKRVYYLTCLVAIPSSMHILSAVFILAAPAHRCSIPSLPNDTYKVQGPWHQHLINESVPWDEEDDDLSKCHLYELANTTDGNPTRSERSCSKWVYSDKFFDRTFASQVDMVCEDKSMTTYANMIYMAGSLLGVILSGALGDVFGRKKVIFIGVIGSFISVLSAAFVTTYIPFILLRFFTSLTGSGMFLSGFVIGVELVGPNKRRIAGIIIELFWCLGLFMLVLMAYFIRDYEYLLIAISVPTISMISLAFFIPESARWLISKGRLEEASKIIQKAAEVNGVKLPDEMATLEKLEEDVQGDKVWSMFKNRKLAIRCLVIFFNWFVSGMVYYGLSLNVGSLSGNIYLNFFLSSLVEALAYLFCLPTLDRLGRRFLQCSSMIVAGVACLGTMFPVMYGGDDVQWVTVALSLIGKFGSSAAFSTIYIFSAELFPTTMRNSGMGLSSSAARIGSISAPYIADINKVITGDLSTALPLVIFGGAALSAGLLALILPETHGRILPESVEDAKNFGKNKKAKKNKYEVDDALPDDSSKCNGHYNPAFTTTL